MLSGRTLRSAAIISLVCSAFCTAAVRAADTHNPLELWYTAPASPRNVLTEGLPIGNGRIGALIGGGVADESIPLNEDSLWTGDTNPTGNDRAAGMGSYQMLGTLQLSLPGHAATNYRRSLDLKTATVDVQYDSGGVHYTRKYFASAADHVIAIVLTADKPGSYSGKISFQDGHNAVSKVEPGRIICAGMLPNNLKYETWVQVQAKKGKDGIGALAGGGLELSNCDSITILVGAATNYAFDASKKYVAGDPHESLAKTISDVFEKSPEALLAAHEKDYKSLFDRCQLNLGKSTDEQNAMPTDKRLAAYFKSPSDPEYEHLFFQYGRYLLISSSRAGGMPANLQGLWNNSNTPPWHADYHTNINVQMCYWPAEVTNISETAQPLFDFVTAQLPDWRATAKTDAELRRAIGPTTRGWTVRTSANPFGGEGYKWNNTANAWLAQHFWEHYAFTQDKVFLKETAYPLLKECCEFWEDHLKAGPDGQLIIPMGWSPEHGPTEDGVTFDQELVWDLFTNYLDAAKVLGVDADYAKKVAEMRQKLLKPKIGSWGQLMEWMTEKTGVTSADGGLDTPQDHHRHASHLFAVFPGRQISFDTTPELAKAAKVSLEARGDFSTGWAMAWRISFWARLLDGDHGYKLLHNLLSAVGSAGSGGLYINLFDAHPPFQIDGNFGGTAGMAEMLLQSQTGEIRVLPALPKVWATGSFKGLKARGNVTVDATWSDSKLTSVTLTSPIAQEIRVRNGGWSAVAVLQAGIARTFELGK